jgi:hypothetical protein
VISIWEMSSFVGEKIGILARKNVVKLPVIIVCKVRWWWVKVIVR